MKRKLKLLVSIGVFVLSMAVMIFGVYSASTVDLSIGGNIVYNAVNIQATISAGTVGSGLSVTDSANKMQAITYDGTFVDYLVLSSAYQDASYAYTFAQDFTFVKHNISQNIDEIGSYTRDGNTLTLSYEDATTQTATLTSNTLTIDSDSYTINV